MDIPIVTDLVDWFLRALGYILMGVVGYRVFMAVQQDNDIQIWKAAFWGFIAFGLITKGENFFRIFQEIWSDILK